MAVAVRTVSAALDADERQHDVFAGTLLVFPAVEPMRELCALVDETCRSVLGTDDPTRAQFEIDREPYLESVARLRKWFRGERPRALLREVLKAVGVDARSTGWDRPLLRFSPHGDDYGDRGTSRLGLHRDTWASNVYSQTNWWAPIYPITSGRAIAFYPRYWAEPLPNTSADWDLDRVMAGADATVVPEPAGAVDLTSELRIVPEPGDVLCFSGAHLHASVPNTTGRARVSIEVRTADVGCEQTGRGAPNIDGEAPHVAHRWFRRIADGASFPELVRATE